jgi:hypothetical protein
MGKNNKIFLGVTVGSMLAVVFHFILSKVILRKILLQIAKLIERKQL